MQNQQEYNYNQDNQDNEEELQQQQQQMDEQSPQTNKNSNYKYNQNQNFDNLNEQKQQYDNFQQKKDQLYYQQQQLLQQEQQLDEDQEQLGNFYPSINCLYHPTYFITNFCTDINCLLPLCPQCVKLHIQEHKQKGTFGDIDTLDNIYDKTINQVKLCQSYYQGKQEKIQLLKSYKDSVVEDLEIKLNELKQNIQSQLEQTFRYIRQALQEKVNEYVSKQVNQLEKIQESNIEKESYFDQYLEGLYSQQKCLKYLIQFYSEGFLHKNQNEIRDLDQKIDFISNSDISLEINEDLISDMFAKLQHQIVKITTTQLFQNSASKDNVSNHTSPVKKIVTQPILNSNNKNQELFQYQYQPINGNNNNNINNYSRVIRSSSNHQQSNTFSFSQNQQQIQKNQGQTNSVIQALNFNRNQGNFTKQFSPRPTQINNSPSQNNNNIINKKSYSVIQNMDSSKINIGGVQNKGIVYVSTKNGVNNGTPQKNIIRQQSPIIQRSPTVYHNQQSQSQNQSRVIINKSPQKIIQYQQQQPKVIINQNQFSPRTQNNTINNNNIQNQASQQVNYQGQKSFKCQGSPVIIHPSQKQQNNMNGSQKQNGSQSKNKNKNNQQATISTFEQQKQIINKIQNSKSNTYYNSVNDNNINVSQQQKYIRDNSPNMLNNQNQYYQQIQIPLQCTNK
ncbi:hypothetical protein PPERSA_07499 [Pseudocohnilembus persalinus]|uniref:B box-type domain-containing protein n=1 Tax=Pseudocohnilembus persalinus TaxID=266149 RepID=A0A0V0R0Q0_PSEPJ|nr:hypothetical protein PPERSA_07499 [Pseudocohnilembus persalinus]|eukprot:KRX07749.1 hypothetical protein PPERSA_07499 [Pseudocohnilembus persalinus]